jgi:exodeoxyribonuclease VII small subunit
MTQPAPPPQTFELAVTELETIVRQLETGSLSLEHALEHYRRGVELLRHCQARLDAVEQQVSILENDELQPFAAQEAGS